MDFDGFDWDPGNRTKCQQHGMSLAEIESVFAVEVVVLPDKGNPAGEVRFRAIGVTSAGRKAFVVFTVRRRDGCEYVRPISARYMHNKEVRSYEKDHPNV